MPSSHNRTDAFTFEPRFSEDVELSYRNLRDHAFVVTAGTVNKARRLELGSNVRWKIRAPPDGNGAVGITLPATSDRNDDGTVCTEDDRMLSNRNELTVSGLGS